MKTFKNGIRILKDQLDKKLRRFRIKHYYEFVVSVLGFGLSGIYLLYIWARLVVFPVYIATTLPYNISVAMFSMDLAGFFFALTPFFNFASSICLLSGCIWAMTKLFRHSLVKISDIELLPLSERIVEIEKEAGKYAIRNH